MAKYSIKVNGVNNSNMEGLHRFFSGFSRIHKYAIFVEYFVMLALANPCI
jgi:hypothetical protein